MVDHLKLDTGNGLWVRCGSVINDLTVFKVINPDFLTNGHLLLNILSLMNKCGNGFIIAVLIEIKVDFGASFRIFCKVFVG